MKRTNRLLIIRPMFIVLSILVAELMLTAGGQCYPPMTDLLMKGELGQARTLLKSREASALSGGTKSYYRGVLESDGNESAKYLKESLYGGRDFDEKGLACIRLAHYYYARGFYITCISQLENFAAENPKSPRKDEAGWLLGMSCLNSGRYEAAQAAFTRVIENYPQSSFAGWAFMGLGQCYYQLGDYDKAQRSFERLVDDKSRSAYPQALAMLSHCRQQIEDTRQAERYRRRYESSFPQSFFGDEIMDVVKISDEVPLSKIDHKAEKLVGAKYYVQVGAFSSKANANVVRSRLDKRGYGVEMEKQTTNKQRYYKVLVGPYSTRSRAQAVKEKLERDESDSFLIILK